LPWHWWPVSLTLDEPAVSNPRRLNIATPNLTATCLTLFVLVGAAFISPTPSSASTPGSKPRSSTLQGSLDAIAANYRMACQSPGAAVSVRTSQGSSYFALSGQFAPGVALGRNSQFLVGSVTKLYVATIALQLIAEHRLSLDDTVDRYLREWPRGSRITIAMLLGHRSGMGDFGNDFSKQQADLVLSNLRRDFSYNQVLHLVRAVPPVAPPGAIYHYSNANYIVLGAILQRITHRTLGTLIDSRILRPLRLDLTLYGPDNLKKANAITFHGLYDVFGNGTPIDIGGFPRNSALTVDPAGAGLFSSLPDLLTFANILFGSDKLLATQERAELSKDGSTISANDLLLDRRFAIVGHGGASPGAQTIVAFDSTHRTTVAVWCNRLDPGANELVPSVIASHQIFELVSPPVKK
jgi:D-alanyl-D-alanine carboxypeptidase